MQLYTIGHSTHPIDYFIELLNEFHITHLIDVRSYPGSRRMPWFGKQALDSKLTEIGIRYTHLPSLGGRRKPNKDSINLALRNQGFRGYADYMQTGLFTAALNHLNSFLNPNTCVAIMCAESYPRKCHRCLVADAEVARGIEVLHILNNKKLLPHELSREAQVVIKNNEVKVFYPKSKS